LFQLESTGVKRIAFGAYIPGKQLFSAETENDLAGEQVGA